jgi:hypothetical protein
VVAPAGDLRGNPAHRDIGSAVVSTPGAVLLGQRRGGLGDRAAARIGRSFLTNLATRIAVAANNGCGEQRNNERGVTGAPTCALSMGIIS